MKQTAPASDPLPLVERHFPELAAGTRDRLGRLAALVREWNARLNLISRRDIAHLEVHHLLHSLALARVWQPADGARAIDVGTGGGFPGLPLAIVFPTVRFTLVDSVAKKGRAVAAMAKSLGLENVEVITARVESIRDRFDYGLGRAVAALPEFLRWTSPLVRAGGAGSPENGIFYFKGTRFEAELAGLAVRPSQVWPLDRLVPEPFFEGKFLLHFPATDLS